MNIYTLKRDAEQIEHEEFAGFVVRAANENAAMELVANEYNLDRAGSNEWVSDHYTYEFVPNLIASGVAGEPAIIMGSTTYCIQIKDPLK